MMPLRPQRGVMVAAGATLIAAGLFTAPGTGSAQVGEGLPPIDPGLTSTSVPLPSEADPLIGKIEELTGATITTTTTTTSPTTTTTVPEDAPTTTTSTTTTTTTQPVAKSEAKSEVPRTALEELIAAIEVPVIDVPAVVADYGRTEFPAYTPRFGKRSTLEVIQTLEGRGLDPEAVAKVMAPFPVSGAASYTDDWGAPRYTPYFHSHEGTDIFATMGTPVIATMAGTVSRVTHGTPVGGNVVYLQLADGTYFYYAHLDTISPLVQAGMAVEPGHVLGTVGNTGNADGGMPHLHFEIHPGGGDPVPPAPYLDAWLAAALDEARGVNGPTVAPPRFPAPLEGRVTEEAGALPAQPASFGYEQTGTLVFLIPGTAVLWWRRRRHAALMAVLEARETVDS